MHPDEAAWGSCHRGGWGGASLGLIEHLKRPRFEQLGRRIAPHLQAGETFLDVGGGSGRLAAWLRDRSGTRPTICDTAADPDRDLSLPVLGQENPRLLPAGRGEFDAVLLAFVLHHVERWEDQEGLLREAARVARRRVLLVEDTPVSRWDRASTRAFDWILNVGRGTPVPFTFRSAGEWVDVLERVGLRVVHQETFRSGWPTMGLYRQSLFVASPALPGHPLYTP